MKNLCLTKLLEGLNEKKVIVRYTFSVNYTQLTSVLGTMILALKLLMYI